MEIKDNRLVDRKQTVEIAIAQSVWVFSISLQLEKVNNVNEAEF